MIWAEPVETLGASLKGPCEGFSKSHEGRAIETLTLHPRVGCIGTDKIHFVKDAKSFCGIETQTNWMNLKVKGEPNYCRKCLRLAIKKREFPYGFFDTVPT